MKKYILTVLLLCYWPALYYAQAQSIENLSNPETVAQISDDAAIIVQETKHLENGLANYLQALQNKNEGLVESAMVNLIKMKYHYPDLDYSKIIEQLQYLQEQGRTQSLRLLAYFAKRYLQEPENFGWLMQNDNEFAIDSGYFFKLFQE
jgi:hypothetical protein